MKRRIIMAVLAAVLLAQVAPTFAAGLDRGIVFINPDGVDGETSDKDHKGWPG